MANPWTRRVILIEAGVVASGIAFVGWLVGGLVDVALFGAVAGSVAGGGFAGVLATRGRDTILVGLAAATPPLAVVLLAMPPPPYYLGGIVRILAAVVIVGLVALGLISALIGVWIQRRVDRRPAAGRPAMAALTTVAGIAGFGWLWFAASLRAS